MSEETKEILDDLKETADNCVFMVFRSQEELDQMPRYTSNFMSINDRQAKKLLKYIEDLQQKVEQLENIRKEAIEFIDWHYKDNKEFFKNKGIGLNYPECDALLNILNKGDNKE